MHISIDLYIVIKAYCKNFIYSKIYPLISLCIITYSNSFRNMAYECNIIYDFFNLSSITFNSNYYYFSWYSFTGIGSPPQPPFLSLCSPPVLFSFILLQWESLSATVTNSTFYSSVSWNCRRIDNVGSLTSHCQGLVNSFIWSLPFFLQE